MYEKEKEKNRQILQNILINIKTTAIDTRFLNNSKILIYTKY